MLTRDTFLAIVEAHLKGRSAVEVSKAAGLPGGSISSVRKGSIPSIERAAQLLDALGLELRVCRKGEHIDSRALRLAIDELRETVSGWARHGISAPRETQLLAEFYARYAAAFQPESTGDPDAVFRALSAMTVEVIDTEPDESGD